MPKFGAHILVADLAAERRLDLFDNLGPSNAMRLGGVGPDLALFLMDPFRAGSDKIPGTKYVVSHGLNIVMDLLRERRKIKNEFEKIEALFDGPADDLLSWMTGDLSTALSELAKNSLEALLLTLKLAAALGAGGFNLSNPLIQALTNAVTDPQSLLDKKYLDPDFFKNPGNWDNFGFPFRTFGHPFTYDPGWVETQTPGDYSKWWWMDLLHYRETGVFADHLRGYAFATTSRSAQAYAHGYMSHVAADICGHPFINAIVGGPFRNHAYRHIVLEGLADTWLWHHQGRGDIAQSKLHTLVQVSDQEQREIATCFLQALRHTYRDNMVPSQLLNGYPMEAELIAAYQLMIEYLDLSTDGTAKRPAQPPDNPGELLKELQDLLSRNMPGQWPPSSGRTGWRLFLAVCAWIFKGIVILIMLSTLPLAIAQRFAQLQNRWLIYTINMAVYHVISGLRTLLALLGYGYASIEDFENFGDLHSMVRAGGFDAYPYQSPPTPRAPLYWLAPPWAQAKRWGSAGLEQPATNVGPIKAGSSPYWMIDPANRMTTRTSDLLRLLRASGPVETQQILSQLGGEGFGNAIDFLFAIREGVIPAPNLDLDGDRGYAYRPWEWNPTAPNVRYV